MISKLERLDPAGNKDLPFIGPGLFDIQINGYMGVDFNDPGLTPEDMELTARRLLANGITDFCPTLITNTPERINRQLQVLAKSCKLSLCSLMIDGIHLEGPFISKENGPRGAHTKEYCTMPDTDLAKQWLESSEGRLRIITLAPELTGAMELISWCAEEGIIAGIGHTAATVEQIRESVDRGAQLSTHLGNGAHKILPRHPNYIWEQLAEDKLYASIIADGFHLPESVLKVIIRVKQDKTILISDGMPYAGLKPGHYHSPHVGRIVLTPEGMLHREADPSQLAGSACTLAEALLNMSRVVPLEMAWKMASIHPANLMNKKSCEDLSKGSPANLVTMSIEKKKIHQTGIILNGKCIKDLNAF